MPIRVNNKPMPPIEIVDMCNEFRMGNTTMLSSNLMDKLDKTLKNDNQAILFINRRGFSSYLMCRECSYIPKCTECDANLVYHKSDNMLKCHYCGKKFRTLTKCPECNSDSIKFGATGTQKIVELLHEHFPDARIFSCVSPLLEHFAIKSKEGNCRKLFAHLRGDRLETFVFDKGKLMLCNAFNCKKTADRVYYLLYIWQQQGLSQEKDQLHLAGDIEHKEELLDELRKFLRNIMIMPKLNIPFDIQTLLTCE
jgi:hypothetical protein